jgi:iron complex outermembrane receptor protein
MINLTARRALLATTIMAGAMFAMPVVAQTAAQTAPQAADTAPEADNDTIVVTGSLLSRKDFETPSPVSVITADDLAVRGITTVQAGIQSLASNNGPALTNSFSANGAFAGGASAVSLRGLTTNSTLVLFDGLRAAYYPLADDGTRNFVDLNTIPDEIVESVEVLKDGGSALYGADAVAGVVNIITKKQINGLFVNAEAGISQQGDAGNQRLSATYGYGKLDEQGFNAYISAHYVHSDALYNRDRGYPYNTDNQSGLCYNGVCGPNNIANGVTNGVYNGLSTATTAFMVRPYNAANTTAQGRYQLLNGCGNLTPYTLTPSEFANNVTAPGTVCQQDITHDYSQILPKLTRWGVSGRVTVNVGSNAQAYLEGNYENSYSAYTGLASIIRSAAPAGIDFPAYTTAAGSTVLTLPVFVCPRGTVNCTAANGTLNPNNPFAAQGEVARLIGRLPTSTESNSSLSQVFRAAGGIKGTFGDDWHYTVDGTAMISRLKTTANGYVYIQHLLDEVADGSYNFVNPAQTSQAALNYLTPTQVNHSSSHLYQGQATVSRALFALPGGDVQASLSGAIRYESLNNPSGNPDANGSTERYFRLNAFGASGHRTVESVFGEVSAPIFDQLEVDASGRFDHYSTGSSNFSPKIGAKFTPIKQISFRGTYSRGFRIPSFAETGSLPTTGYVTTPLATLPAAYIAQHLTAAGTPNLYITNCVSAVCVGQTTVGNPDLKPEKSRNYTLGVILKPIPAVTFTIDYYNIEKKNAITSVNFSSAISNYYATGQTSFNGVTIIPDEPDADHPTAQRRVAFAQGSFINANKVNTSGIDFGLQGRVHLTPTITFNSSVDATYLIKLNTTYPDGHTEHYAGTLGNYNLTAGSGTQRWRGTWQNTVDFGTAALSATANYTSGYNYSAEDQGGVAGDCGLVPTNLNGDAFQPCNVKSFITVDLTGTIKVNDDFSFYVNVLNVANRKAPIDATTYGAYLYNPVVGESGIIGRQFRAGVRAKF